MVMSTIFCVNSSLRFHCALFVACWCELNHGVNTLRKYLTTNLFMFNLWTTNLTLG